MRGVVIGLADAAAFKADDEMGLLQRLASGFAAAIVRPGLAPRRARRQALKAGPRQGDELVVFDRAGRGDDGGRGAVMSRR